jgi:hypothetical protein
MNVKLYAKISSWLVFSLLVGISSCKEEDERITIQDTKDISEEAVTDSYFQDMDDMAGVAIETPTEDEYAGGRVSGTITIDDHRFDCPGVVVTLTRDAASTKANPKGILTVDFGSGCQDNRGNTRKGKLTFSYNGRRFLPQSSVVTTTENYSINGVKLEGVRTMTNVQNSTAAAPRYNIVLTGGKATFEDGSVAERTSNITLEWVRAANPTEDQLIIDQTSVANGKTRGGKTYEVSVLESLKYKRFCGIAVDGIKKYVIDNNKEITIDYGDGGCDKEVAITVNGITRNVTVD